MYKYNIQRNLQKNKNKISKWIFQGNEIWDHIQMSVYTKVSCNFTCKQWTIGK